MKRLLHVVVGLALALGLGSATANPPWLFVQANNSLVFQNLFTSGTLVSQKGPTLSLTRATASTTTDFEGLVRPLPSGAARFWKLRMVYNQIAAASSEDITVAGYAKTNGTASAGTFTATSANATIIDSSGPSLNRAVYRVQLTRVTGTGNVQLTADNGATWTTVSVTSTPTTFTVSASSSAGKTGVRLVTSGDAVAITYWQVEETIGQAISAPSEYVSKGVLAAPYHGAGVDALKFFNTANATTVV